MGSVSDFSSHGSVFFRLEVILSLLLIPHIFMPRLQAGNAGVLFLHVVIGMSRWHLLNVCLCGPALDPWEFGLRENCCQPQWFLLGQPHLGRSFCVAASKVAPKPSRKLFPTEEQGKGCWAGFLKDRIAFLLKRKKKVFSKNTD